MELWRLLAHSHWFTLNILGYEARVCARCSGYILGFAVPLLLFKTLGVEFSGLMGPFWQQVCFLLTLPLVVDWVTQSWGLRRSNNLLRVASGILLGLDLFIFTKLGISLDTKRLVFVAAALVTVFMGSIGKLCISHREKRL